MATNYGATPIVTDGLVYIVDFINPASFPAANTTSSIHVNTSNFTTSGDPVVDKTTGLVTFDGNDFIDTPDNDAVFNFGANDWTIDFIFKRSTSGTGLVLNQSNSNAASDSLFTIYITGNQIGIYVTAGTGWTYNYFNTTTLGVGTFYHCHATREGTNLRIYVDGVSTGQTDIGSITLPNSGRDFQFATQEGGASFTGQIGPVKIYNRALTAAEKQQNINAMAGRFA
jgi:hypothetical protein